MSYACLIDPKTLNKKFEDNFEQIDHTEDDGDKFDQEGITEQRLSVKKGDE